MANLAEYKKAIFNYEILEDFEAGLELIGSEVKSVRGHKAMIDGARVIVRGGEGFLVGATIPAYQPANMAADYDAGRNRRLLLNKKELATLMRAEEERGLTVIPLSFYEKGRLIKVKVAVVRGKKKHDKRESLKKREADRDIQRAMKR